MYLELFLFNHSRIQYGVDHRAVPHERLGIDSAALSEQIGLKQIRLSRRVGSEPFRPPVDAILPGRRIGFV